MDLLVTKFTLRYNGKDYKAGDILNVIDDDKARAIIRIADGDVIAVNSTNVEEEKPQADADVAEDDGGIPPVDPKKTVRRSK